MTKIYLLLIIIFFSSCAESKNSKLKKIETGIKKWIEDEAFKQNQKATIYELKAIDFEMVGENRKDSISQTYYRNKAAKYLKLSQDNRKEASNYIRQAELYSQIDIKTDFQTEQAKELLNVAKSLLDSVDYFNGLDSLAGVRIKNRKTQNDNYYYSKVFFKASLGKENILDTVFILLNNEFVVIKNK